MIIPIQLFRSNPSHSTPLNTSPLLVFSSSSPRLLLVISSSSPRSLLVLSSQLLSSSSPLFKPPNFLPLFRSLAFLLSRFLAPLLSCFLAFLLSCFLAPLLSLQSYPSCPVPPHPVSSSSPVGDHYFNQTNITNYFIIAPLFSTHFALITRLHAPVNTPLHDSDNYLYSRRILSFARTLYQPDAEEGFPGPPFSSGSTKQMIRKSGGETWSVNAC